MSDNNEEWIEIGYGEDGSISHWHADLTQVMDRIDQYIVAIDEHQLDLNWDEICAPVPALRGKAWDIEKERPSASYLEALEFTMDCYLDDEEYDGGMPGNSGHFLTLVLQASKKQAFIETMEQPLSSLETYWKEHHLPEVD